jgi:hypothetical protein
LAALKALLIAEGSVLPLPLPLPLVIMLILFYTYFCFLVKVKQIVSVNIGYNGFGSNNTIDYYSVTGTSLLITAIASLLQVGYRGHPLTELHSMRYLPQNARLTELMEETSIPCVSGDVIRYLSPRLKTSQNRYFGLQYFASVIPTRISCSMVVFGTVSYFDMHSSTALGIL